MKIFNKKLLLIALIFVLLISVTISSYADILDPEFYKGETGYSKSRVWGENTKYSQIISKILGVVRTVGFVVAVGGIMILGIQTMMASVEEKAIYKQKMIPFIVGLVLLITITTVISTIQYFTERLDWQTPSGPDGSVPLDPEDPGDPIPSPEPEPAPEPMPEPGKPVPAPVNYGNDETQ